jgi:hypothetical protein
MSRLTYVVLAALVLPTVAAAQEAPVAEIGTNAGLVVQSGGGTSVTQFGIPGQGILGQPTLYATFFTADVFMIEPQLALNTVSGGGVSFTTLGLGGQVGYLFDGPMVNSTFAAGSLQFQSISTGGNSTSDVGLGGIFGYRILIGSTAAVRLQAGYRRWFDSHLNEFSFGVALGALIHRR